LPNSIARRYADANHAGRQNLSFDLSGCLRKGTAVRRNILRRNEDALKYLAKIGMRSR
jgi:hypothetical protein